MSFYSLHINNIKPGDMEIISGLCFRYELSGLEEFENQVYLFSDASSEKILSEVGRELSLALPHVEVSGKNEIIKDENWQDNWKWYFKPQKVGKFVVYPPWEDPGDGLVPIIINPKMAFGTGTHESTQLVLELMEFLNISGKKILDLGCGSGILSIGAAKLEAKEVVGIDIDPIALVNAKENAELNHIPSIEFLNTTIGELSKSDFNIIFANIIKDVLITLAPHIIMKLAEDGILLLSGLTEDDVKEIIDTYEARGLKLKSQKIKNEWAALIFIRG